jgi:hypothetical protein
MAFEMLQAVVGAAVIDSDFRRAILNGPRHSVIHRFDLSREETDAVMSIQADTLAQFAGQLDQWIMKQENRLEPMALDLPALALITQHDSNGQRASAPIEKRPILNELVVTSSFGPA